MAVMLEKILDIIDDIAPFALEDTWDNSGLQVGSIDMEIDNIALGEGGILGLGDVLEVGF